MGETMKDNDMSKDLKTLISDFVSFKKFSSLRLRYASNDSTENVRLQIVELEMLRPIIELMQTNSVDLALSPEAGDRAVWDEFVNGAVTGLLAKGLLDYSVVLNNIDEQIKKLRKNKKKLEKLESQISALRRG